MNNKGFQIKGDSTNRNHLSVGAVLLENQLVTLIKKPDGMYTLPRETMYSAESLEDSVFRGVGEETGVQVTVEKYLGSLISHFNREDGTDVEKTTIYFLAKKVGDAHRNQADDELKDLIELLPIQKAIDTFKSQKNEEYKILEELLKYP